VVEHRQGQRVLDRVGLEQRPGLTGVPLGVVGQSPRHRLTMPEQ